MPAALAMFTADFFERASKIAWQGHFRLIEYKKRQGARRWRITLSDGGTMRVPRRRRVAAGVVRANLEQDRKSWLFSYLMKNASS